MILLVGNLVCLYADLHQETDLPDIDLEICNIPDHGDISSYRCNDQWEVLVTLGLRIPFTPLVIELLNHFQRSPPLFFSGNSWRQLRVIDKLNELKWNITSMIFSFNLLVKDRYQVRCRSNGKWKA